MRERCHDDVFDIMQAQRRPLERRTYGTGLFVQQRLQPLLICKIATFLLSRQKRSLSGETIAIAGKSMNLRGEGGKFGSAHVVRAMFGIWSCPVTSPSRGKEYP